MIEKFFILYILIFFFLCLTVFFVKNSKMANSLITLIIFLQVCLFFSPLNRSFSIFLKGNISLTEILFYLSLIIITSLLILRARQKKRNIFFLRYYFFVLAKIEYQLKKLIYINQHCYYVANKFFPYFEKLLRPLLLKPYNPVFYITFGLNFLIFFLGLLESFLYESITLSVVVFILTIFFFKLLKIIFIIISQMSKNSVSYNSYQALFNLYLPKNLNAYQEKFIKKEKLFFFLDRNRLDKIIYLDSNFNKNHLEEKFLIIYSMVHFSSIFFIIYCLDKYFIFYYRLISNIYLFSAILFILAINKILTNYFLINSFILLDAFIFFAYFNYLFFSNFISVYLPYRKVSDLLRMLTFSVPNFSENFKKLLLETNLVNNLAKDPRSIYVNAFFKKPDFFEGFNEVSFGDNRKKGFPWKKLTNFLFSVYFVFFGYFFLELLLKLLFPIFSNFCLFCLLILSLIKQSLTIIYWLLLMLK